MLRSTSVLVLIGSYHPCDMEVNARGYGRRPRTQAMDAGYGRRPRTQAMDDSMDYGDETRRIMVISGGHKKRTSRWLIPIPRLV